MTAFNPGKDLSFSQIDPKMRGYLEDYLARNGVEPTLFATPLPGDDEMFFKAVLPNYAFDTGIAAFKFAESTVRHYFALEQIAGQVFGGVEKLDSILDFASGYGRLTRVLLQKLPREKIWVSDIYADAMAWQRKAFGVNTVVSATDPTHFTHDRQHDIIFVGSLFSHLPAPTFRAWLRTLAQRLSPRGVLAFSVHDAGIIPPGAAADPSGLTYLRFSESGSLDLDSYGMSYVTEAFVGQEIASTPGVTAWKRFPKALYENQDLYVTARDAAAIADLKVVSPPMGGLERVTSLPTGAIDFSGWAIERTPGARITEIAAYAGDDLIARVAPSTERPDVLAAFPDAANLPVGWTLRVEPGQGRPGAMLRFELVSTTGARGLAYATQPEPASFTYSGWSRRALL